VWFWNRPYRVTCSIFRVQGPFKRKPKKYIKCLIEKMRGRFCTILIFIRVTTTFYTPPTFRKAVRSIGEEVVLVDVPANRTPPPLPSHPTWNEWHIRVDHQPPLSFRALWRDVPVPHHAVFGQYTYTGRDFLWFDTFCIKQSDHRLHLFFWCTAARELLSSATDKFIF
jgi:hypothetical protein